jgi:hypothetical protein
MSPNAVLNDPFSKHSDANNSTSFIGTRIRNLGVDIMSADSVVASTVVASTVDEKTQEEARSLVISGVLAFLDTTRSNLLKWFKGFEDLEVAVNKKSLTSDNCKAVLGHEVAHIVRMTEVFNNKEDTSRVPRTLSFGIVMMKMATSEFRVRLWGALEPVWQGGTPEALEANTAGDIKKITDELMLSMCKVCSDKFTTIQSGVEILS